MKKLEIPFIPSLNETNIENAGSILDEFGANAAIEVLNWSQEYGYKPNTSFRIGRSDEAIFIKYLVNETSLRAAYSEDQSPVHEDSCVEFFCMPEGAEKYTNFEFNCIGTCSASSRKGRSEDVVPFPKEDMLTIERHSSVGKEPFAVKEGTFTWDLTVKIPFKLLGLDATNLPEKIRGNFYKCGDKTNPMHFVSWSPIHTENPDFHRPEFFGELVFV